MKTTSHYRLNFNLALPVIISQLGHMTVSVADSIMVGRVGVAELAAVALGNSIYAVFMLFGLGLAYGLTPLVAYADGKVRTHLQGVLLNNSLIINVIAGILLAAIVIGFVPLLRYFRQDADVVMLAGPYMNIVAFSLLPLMVFMTFKQFAEGLSLTRIAMAVSITCNVINVGLNYIFIYGKWGLPPMGVSGAALATLLARILMAALMIWYIYSHSRFVMQRSLLFRFRYNRTVLQKLMRIGIPSGLQYIFEVTAFSVAAVFAGMLGAQALAAHQIAINIASVSYMAATGLGAAATIRVGTEFGKGNYTNLKAGARSIFVMTVMWMAAAGLLILFFRYTLAGFYTTEPEVISLAAAMLLVVVLFQISDGLQAVCLGALRGFTDVKIPTIITFLAYWLLSVPVSYFLSQHTALGVMGIWYSLAGALTLSAILLLSRFYNLSEKFRKRILLKKPKTL